LLLLKLTLLLGADLLGSELDHVLLFVRIVIFHPELGERPR
jgi:hypothetical protein